MEKTTDIKRCQCNAFSLWNKVLGNLVNIKSEGIVHAENFCGTQKTNVVISK